MKFLAKIVQQSRESWVGSLRLRMTAISVGLSLVAVAAIGSFLSYTIEQNLFESRRNEVISETQSVSDTVSRNSMVPSTPRMPSISKPQIPTHKRQFAQQLIRQV